MPQQIQTRTHAQQAMTQSTTEAQPCLPCITEASLLNPASRTESSYLKSAYHATFDTQVFPHSAQGVIDDAMGRRQQLTQAF
jgi:hypothetical protein